MICHSRIIGQIVPKVNPSLSNFFRGGQWHKLFMQSGMTPAEFESMFIARVKALRELSGMTSAQMAEALDINAERYRKYESRTPMPHEMIERFALIVRQPVAFVLTGRRVKGGGLYPDVPGPHCLDEWRESQLAPKTSQRGRKKQIA